MKIVATKAEDLLRVLHTGKSSVNHYLRRLVHHAENLGWLHWMIMAPAAWPKPKKSNKRGVTDEEHAQIIAAEKNPERRAYYEMLWVTGGSQLDVALLRRENIRDDVLVYQRRKLGETATPCSMTVGSAMRVLLANLPASGWLFPTLAKRELDKPEGDLESTCCRVQLVDADSSESKISASIAIDMHGRAERHKLAIHSDTRKPRWAIKVQPCTSNMQSTRGSPCRHLKITQAQRSFPSTPAVRLAKNAPVQQTVNEAVNS